MAASSVSDLPPEIVGEIFLQGLEPYDLSKLFIYYAHQAYLSRICRVSKLWHDIACSLPDLWTVVQIDHPAKENHDSPPRGYRRRQLHLQRAKHVPLSVILRALKGGKSISLPDEQPTFWMAWRELTQTATRWRSLQVNGFVICRSAGIDNLLPSLLPNLTEIKSSLYMWGSREPISSAPRLRYFEAVNDYGIFPFISSDVLQSLCLRGTIWNFSLVLIHATGLQSLEVTALHLPSNDFSDLTLPSLRHFTAIGDTWYLREFLAKFKAPNLEMISLLNVPPGRIGPNARHYESDPESLLSFPSLMTVEFGTNRRGTTHLAILCQLIASLDDGGRAVAVRMTRASSSVPRDIHPTFFRVIEADVEWLEGRVKNVVWMDIDEEAFFRSWYEAQRHFASVGASGSQPFGRPCLKSHFSRFRIRL